MEMAATVDEKVFKDVCTDFILFGLWSEDVLLRAKCLLCC